MVKPNRIAVVSVAYALMGALWFSILAACAAGPARSADVVVVGAGISGLSSAWELARGGARVLVIDTAGQFGGHAVKAEGGLCIVGTAFQLAHGITDSPDIAYKDFMTWGEDANPDWVRYYVNNSNKQIYEWLTKMGVRFTVLAKPAGNSVPRFHLTRGLGVALVTAIYEECRKNPNITFEWNERAARLVVDNHQVKGVVAQNATTGKTETLTASSVILATGGFQSNLKMVREHWPSAVPFPSRFLIGSGENAQGSGLSMAQSAGAVLFNMDHQWNYPTGLPDPRYPGKNRGLNARCPDSIWVNSQGKRFVKEYDGVYNFKEILPALLKQKPATYWAVFDRFVRPEFWVSGSEWADPHKIQTLIFDNRQLAKSASSLDALARAAGLPPGALAETVNRYNRMVEAGEDKDFHRFGPSKSYLAHRILTAPFYAVQFFPVTRKSMGGVSIDLSGHVLDGQKHPIPGLYAAGELTGFGGINGKAGLEGTFLGPCIVTGRVAGRTALKELKTAVAPSPHPVP